jgi:hypothetical protein
MPYMAVLLHTECASVSPVLVIPVLAVCDQCGAKEQVLIPIPDQPNAMVQFFTLPGSPAPPGWEYSPRKPEMTLPPGYNGRAILCPECAKKEHAPKLKAVK